MYLVRRTTLEDQMKRALGVLLTLTALVGCKKDDETSPVAPPVTYTRVFIEQVSIVAMPFVDGSGIAWDLTSGPDPFYNLVSNPATIVSSTEGSYRPDITPSSLPVAWSYSPAFEITDWTQYYYLALYDYDPADANDVIGSTGIFRMEDVKAGYPVSYTASNTSGTIQVRLTLRWQ
jgi:hypothetical protein